MRATYRFSIALLTLFLSNGCVTVDSPALRREADRRGPESRALKAGLEHRDAALRAEAAAAMGRHGLTTYAPALRRALRDDNAAVRFEAAFALGQLWIEDSAPAPREVVEEVLPISLDPDPKVRAAAIEALGKLGPPDLEPRFVALLSDPEPRARREAAAALFRLRYLKRLTTYSTSTVAALSDAAGDPDLETRWRAVYAFSRWPEPSAAPVLSKAAEDEDPLVRLFALRSLGQLGATAPEEPVRAGTLDADERVRAEAHLAAKALGRPGLVAPKAPRDPSVHVRAAAADALGAPEGSLELLDELAKDESSFVRGQAVASLAKRQGEAFAERLATFAREPDPLVRARACAATSELPKNGAAIVESCLKDSDLRVRASALEAAAARPGADVDVLLSVALSDPASPIELRGSAMEALAKRKAPELVGALVKAYENSSGREWVEVREAAVDAAEALAKENPKDGRLAAFRKRLLEDSAYSVRAKAAKSLGLPAPTPEREPASPFVENKPEGRPLLTLETDKGVILLELAPEHAPVHAASFLDLVRRGFYDGLTVHRLVINFVAQGGDPRGTGWGDPGYALRDEINPLKFQRGTIGMAKAGRDTGGCQLFVALVPTPHLDGRYTAFGRVAGGMDVVDRLAPGDVIRRARER